jgi:hypothetical protein
MVTGDRASKSALAHGKRGENGSPLLPLAEDIVIVTALTDAVQSSNLASLVSRRLDRFAEPDGRVIISSYWSSGRRGPRRPSPNV